MNMKKMALKSHRVKIKNKLTSAKASSIFLYFESRTSLMNLILSAQKVIVITSVCFIFYLSNSQTLRLFAKVTTVLCTTIQQLFNSTEAKIEPLRKSYFFFFLSFSFRSKTESAVTHTTQGKPI